MLDIGSILFNLKYKGDGIKLVSPEKYCEKIMTSRDKENSSGLEYICAQINDVNDYNAEALRMLSQYH